MVWASRHPTVRATEKLAKTTATPRMLGTVAGARTSGTLGAVSDSHHPTAVEVPEGRLPATRTALPDGLRAARAEPTSEGGKHDEGAEGPKLRRGSKIGVYEIIRPIGAGGMGSVHLARDPRLGRRVAIKVIAESKKALRERLLVEARNTARCRHENIVVIFEVGEIDGFPFLVLEYLEGQALGELLDGNTLSPRRAVEIALPIARALEAAHAMGVVHRDLKPANVFITESGAVKVLDFGVAKAIGRDASLVRSSQRPTDPQRTGDPDRTGTRPISSPPEPSRSEPPGRLSVPPPELSDLTRPGVIVGTLRYMSPEQLRAEEVDGRADIWALGLLLHQMIVGHHPLGETLQPLRLQAMADGLLEMPSEEKLAEDIPAPIAAIIARCLRTDPADRYPDATSLIADLEAYANARARGAVADGECPYPGLSSFREAHADVFFGRDGDVRRLRARLVDQPFVVVAGASGVGKSSLVQAGLVPSLLRSGEPWEVFRLRPGRRPLAACAALLSELSGEHTDTDVDARVERLRAEPGTLGTELRSLARRRGSRVLLVVDQLEELYTQEVSRADRRAFTAAISAVADDVASPLRVVATLRADFTGRVAEDERFMESVTRGLMLLPPLGREGLRETLVQPAALVGYTVDEGVVDAILDSVSDTAGALPLLQFAATKLWDGRDKGNQTLTREAYDAMGGIEGALASHADAIFAELPQETREEARPVFLRLVTPERTRAIATLAELSEQSERPKRVLELVEALVRARLLVAHDGSEETTVEIAHEALIESWPMLGRWIEAERDDVVALHQLRDAARQWDARGRPSGLLWRGDALVSADRLKAKESSLSKQERAFLDAALDAERRSRRRRRWGLIAAMGVAFAVAAGALTAMVLIGGAERDAREEAERARDEAERALAAEQEATQAAERAAQERVQRQAAESRAAESEAEVELREEDLAMTNAQLEEALERQRSAAERARAARVAAEREASRAQEAEQSVRGLLAERERRLRELERRLSKISTELR